jgi:SAM-dependent methyltransferase
MELTANSQFLLAIRALSALRSRGPRYVWHKFLRRSLGRFPAWKRRLLYRDVRLYWILRGGEDYFREQEGQEPRSLRAEWIADRVAAYRPESVLEIGCGYGKVLNALRSRLDIPMVGVDFSPTQLARARQFLNGKKGIATFLASGERLPFPDRSFDMVVTSAVILHNPPEMAEKIRLEILRVARRFAAHNEETGVSYNRYGYDTAAWYRQKGIALAEAGPIPMDSDPRTSQFCVAEFEGLFAPCSSASKRHCFQLHETTAAREHPPGNVILPDILLGPQVLTKSAAQLLTGG